MLRWRPVDTYFFLRARRLRKVLVAIRMIVDLVPHQTACFIFFSVAFSFFLLAFFDWHTSRHECTGTVECTNLIVNWTSFYGSVADGKMREPVRERERERERWPGISSFSIFLLQLGNKYGSIARQRSRTDRRLIARTDLQTAGPARPARPTGTVGKPRILLVFQCPETTAIRMWKAKKKHSTNKSVLFLERHEKKTNKQ